MSFSASTLALIALMLGFATGLGIVRSYRLAHHLTLVALAGQMFGWPLFVLIARTMSIGWSPDWQLVLGATFLLSMIVVFPLTIIGAAIGGSVGYLVWQAVKSRRGINFSTPASLPAGENERHAGSKPWQK